MLLRRVIKFASFTRPLTLSARILKDEAETKDISGSVSTKFQVFRNETSRVIYDIEEQRKIRELNLEQEVETFPSPYEEFNLERGVDGVFEIEHLVDILKKEKARNLCVIKVPKELKYVDYFCIVEGGNIRHMLGMAQFVKKMYKIKRGPGDVVPKIEGETSKDWIAMDLGNIALHIFSKASREYYDLESLWLLGEEYENRIKNPRTSNDDVYAELLKAAAATVNLPDPSDPANEAQFSSM